MCGIVGVVAKKGRERINISEVAQMNRMQRHRGPDDSGMVGLSLDSKRGQVLQNEKIFEGKSIVAFNRLSIQDLSINGHQPMMNINRDVIIAFNGEIYNFRELRSELISKGYSFTSRTDTEVVLSLYLEYGIEKTLKKLNGMFAIAIYDLRINQMYICRDRFGIKPMYIAHTENYFLFGSEIKSFLEFHEFETELETDTLQEYILFRNIIDGCLLKNVKQVLPGEVCQISLQDNRISKWKFFEINNYCRNDKIGINSKVVSGELWDVISDAIKRQMISDVKVGCQLSGGIDSSLVTYIAAEKYGMTDTFSVVVDDERFSEETFIDCVDAKLSTTNHKIKLGKQYYADNFVDTVWHFEGITVHASTLGVYQIAEEAHNQVSVLLSGEGADEVFGGYKCFTKLADKANVSNLDLLADEVISANGKVSDETARKIYPGIQIDKQIEKRRNIFRNLDGSMLDRQIKYEMLTYLPEILIRQDKMSMAHSIENRVPLLDNEVVKYAFTIPESLIINKETKQGKDILKQLCVPIFGKSFAYRKKMGFGMPTNTFLFSNPQFANNIVYNLQKRDLINEKVIKEWSNDVTSLRGLDAELFFKLFSFEVWCELFLDKKNITEVMVGEN